MTSFVVVNVYYMHVCTATRTPTLEVAPQGTTYLRLWFAAATEGQGDREVYLFLNDENGQSEECFLFNLREGGRSAVHKF